MTPLRSVLFVLPILALSLHLGVTASAANILWDGTGTSWNSATAWSLFSNATTPNPAAKPGASDTAIFNIETVNTPQAVLLNAAQSTIGLVFSSTGTVNIQTGAGTNTLTLGSGGISVSAGAGVNTIQTAVSLSAPQAWTNDSSSLLSVSADVSQAGSHLTIGGIGNTTIGGTVNGSGGLTKSGAGRLTLNAPNTFTGGVTINAGDLAIGGAGNLGVNAVTFGPGSTGSLSMLGKQFTVSGLATDPVVGTPVIQNGSSVTSATITVMNATDMTYGGVLQDGGSQPLGLTKRGVGTLTLTGALPYTGVTSVLEGTLRLAGADNPLSGGVFIVSPSSGIYDLNGRSAEMKSLYFLGFASAGGLRNSASGNATLTIPVNVGFDEDSLNVTLSNEGIVDVTRNDGILTLDGRLNGDGRIYKHGLGTWILTRSSSGVFRGTVVVEEGTLAIGHDQALGLAQESVGVSLLGGAVRAEGGARVVANRFFLNSPVATLTGTDDLTLTGEISGPGNLTKEGTGKLTLTNSKTYSGGTTLNGGVLAVNGSILGDVTVNDGGTLAGDGAIGGAVNMNMGGTLAPGDSVGEITVASLTLQEGATVRLEIGGLLAGSQHDQVESAGALALDGTLQVSLVEGFMPTVGQAFDLLNWGTRSGAFDSVQLPSLGGLFWNTSQLYTTGVLSVAVLTGDYNYDGLVDAADYTVWRDTLGSTTSLAADGSGNGIIDIPDFGIWQVNYGATAPANSAVVPEPAGLAAVVSALLMSTAKRRQAASGRR